ncbi:hypothetical protein D9M70_621050 [compost metagenome]
MNSQISAVPLVILALAVSESKNSPLTFHMPLLRWNTQVRTGRAASSLALGRSRSGRSTLGTTLRSGVGGWRSTMNLSTRVPGDCTGPGRRVSTCVSWLTR